MTTLQIPVCPCHQVQMEYHKAIYIKSEDVTLFEYVCKHGSLYRDYGPDPAIVFAPAERVRVSLPSALSRDGNKAVSYYAHVIGAGYSTEQYKVLPEGSDKIEVINRIYLSKVQP
jgi:hypothetical protein